MGKNRLGLLLFGVCIAFGLTCTLQSAGAAEQMLTDEAESGLVVQARVVDRTNKTFVLDCYGRGGNAGAAWYSFRYDVSKMVPADPESNQAVGEGNKFDAILGGRYTRADGSVIDVTDIAQGGCMQWVTKRLDLSTGEIQLETGVDPDGEANLIPCGWVDGMMPAASGISPGYPVFSIYFTLKSDVSFSDIGTADFIPLPRGNNRTGAGVVGTSLEGLFDANQITYRGFDRIRSLQLSDLELTAPTGYTLTYIDSDGTEKSGFRADVREYSVRYQDADAGQRIKFIPYVDETGLQYTFTGSGYGAVINTMPMGTAGNETHAGQWRSIEYTTSKFICTKNGLWTLVLSDPADASRGNTTYTFHTRPAEAPTLSGLTVNEPWWYQLSYIGSDGVEHTGFHPDAREYRVKYASADEGRRIKFIPYVMETGLQYTFTGDGYGSVVNTMQCSQAGTGAYEGQWRSIEYTTNKLVLKQDGVWTMVLSDSTDAARGATEYKFYTDELASLEGNISFNGGAAPAIDALTTAEGVVISSTQEGTEAVDGSEYLIGRTSAANSITFFMRKKAGVKDELSVTLTAQEGGESLEHVGIRLQAARAGAKTITFTFLGVPAGEYEVQAYKKNHTKAVYAGVHLDNTRMTIEEPLSLRAGELTGDGSKIDLRDVNLLMRYYGQTDIERDLNDDDVIDSRDMVLLMTAFEPA